jgi:pyridoxine 5-phosphate synthase
MIRLSVNVNKVATLRNSRGGRVPSVNEAVDVCLSAGAPGITVHPRADERHITREDVASLARQLGTSTRLPEPPTSFDGGFEFNIEGDPTASFVDLVVAARPHQCTLVPVVPGEVTSQAGWSASTSPERLMAVIGRLHAEGIRVSVFVDPEEAAVRWAKRLSADRIELYTEPFARAYHQSREAGRASFDMYAAAATLAHSLGLGINAGHDLDLDNLVLFRELPHLDEVSIGHALISHALYVGLDRAVRDYLDVLGGK